MSAIDLLVAFRNLLQHTRRTLFLGGAIAVVTALLVLLNGLSTGTRETMLRSATTLMSGHVNVGGFYKVTAGQSAPVVTDYKKVLELVKQDVPEMDYVAAARARLGQARLRHRLDPGGRRRHRHQDRAELQAGDRSRQRQRRRPRRSRTPS